MRSLICPPLPECGPGPEQFQIFFFQNTPRRLKRRSSQAYHRAGVDGQFVEPEFFGVRDGCAEVKMSDLCPVTGRQAHRAWLARGVEPAALKPDTFQRAACFTDRTDLGMGRNIGVFPNGVVFAGHYFAVIYNTSAEGRLALADALFGFGDRQAHEPGMHGRCFIVH